MNLFVYGELCHAAVLRAQLGRIPAAVPAILEGYVRRRDPDHGFYVAEAADRGKIIGLLLRGIEPEELARLDAMEGVGEGRYHRADVVVTTVGSGDTDLSAQVYVGGPLPGR